MDPGTIALIAIAASVAAAGVSSYSSYQQGQQASQAAKYNEKIADQRATLARQQSASEAAMTRRRGRILLGKQIAAYGASGVAIDSGTPLDLIASTAQDIELDRQTVLYKGELAAIGYTDQAQLYGFQADNAAASSYTNAASELLKGGGQALSTYSVTRGLRTTPTTETPGLSAPVD